MPGVVPTPELILDPTNGEATVPVDPGSAPGTTAPAEAATVAQPAVPPLTEVAALPTEAPAPPTEGPAPPTEDPVPPSAVAAPGTAAPQAAQELSTATVVQRPATDGDASCRPPGGATASSQRVDSADRQRAISTRKSDVGGARPAATGPGTRSPLVVPAPTMAPTAAASPAPDTSPAPTKPVPPPAPQPAPVAPASPPAHNPGPAPAGQACTTVSVAGTGSGGGSTLDQLAIVEESLTATLSRAWTRLTSRLPARALGSTDQPGARPD
ncbi:hypothetical protein [Blastococcus sp. SYSU DS0973]